MVKLSSGREVETKLLNRRERRRVQDWLMESNQKIGSFFSMEKMLDIFELGTGLKTYEDWTDEEINECASLILQENFATELDKKK
jgi:hypothetical protein